MHYHRSLHSLNQSVSVFKPVKHTIGQPWTATVIPCSAGLDIKLTTWKAELSRWRDDLTYSSDRIWSKVLTLQYLWLLAVFQIACDTNRTQEVAAMWISQFFVKKPSRSPSTHVPVCTTRFSHVMKVKWSHTEKSSIVCWQHPQPATSSPMLTWTLWFQTARLTKCNRIRTSTLDEGPWLRAPLGQIPSQRNIIEGVRNPIRQIFRSSWALNKSASL